MSLTPDLEKRRLLYGSEEEEEEEEEEDDNSGSFDSWSAEGGSGSGSSIGSDNPPSAGKQRRLKRSTTPGLNKNGNNLRGSGSSTPRSDSGTVPLFTSI